MKLGKPNNQTIICICNDCDIVFQVYHIPCKHKFYCPVCGDNVNVIRYKAERHNKDDKAKIRWKDEELLLLQDVLNGKETVYRLAIRIGRSTNAVAKKLERLRRTKCTS